MALGKLDFKAIEATWTKQWSEWNLHAFDAEDAAKPKPVKPVFSIDSPPPFTSGALHMGHVLSYAYFDFAARYKRMRGYNVLYPQGWDCQGFPTEVKVEQKYGRNLSREDFKAKCVAFTKDNIQKMRSQMERLGFSPDWRYEYRTMDEAYHAKVQRSLLDMHEKKRVYRARHPVWFCVNCRSAIAKAETDDQARHAVLNYLPFKSAEGELLIATTRPELLHACVAVLVNPADDRHKPWVGKTVRVPLHGRDVKVLADPDVDASFGTGAVMLCTFGDKQDVVWAHRHALPIIEAMDERGLLKNAGKYTGEHVSKAREAVLEDLAANKLVRKQETLQQTVKVHDRCGKPVEFVLSWQWFLKLKDARGQIIADGRAMRWVPEFARGYLEDWANALEYDWVFSRQRVYGTPIPFYACEKCNEIHAPPKTKLPVDPARDAWTGGPCHCGGEIKGEAGTCDVWVDSSITPLVIAGWPDNKDWQKLYPATLRPQGLEIIRTWAFYTIYRCHALTGQAPFKELLINGNVLGTDGRKMSKSLGNFEDPEVLLGRYASDALRQWAALSGAFAKDRPFNYKDVDFAQSFLNKLWNASNFVDRALEGYAPGRAPAHLRVVDRALLSRLHRLVQKSNAAWANYDYYTALNAVHAFVWSEFCDYYLEEVKHRVYDTQTYGEDSKRAAQFVLHAVLDTVLRLLAPFAPFTTEEIHSHVLAPRGGKRSVHEETFPQAEEAYIKEREENIQTALNSILSHVRRFKASKNLALNESLSRAAVTVPEDLLPDMAGVEEEIKAAGRLAAVEFKAGAELSVELTV